MIKFPQGVAAIAISIMTGALPRLVNAQAPIVPQAGTSTQVQQAGDEFVITGGATSGDGQTLFQTFEQLGLTQGQIATFLAQPEVQAILGSVVGGDASYINGLLRVAGSPADLYLINPAGILFGPQAQLDLSGSFAATTATGVLFDETLFNVLGTEDVGQFSGAPTGFVFAGEATGAIVNVADLTVAPGEAITLIGGQVLSVGSLTAPGGEITIAAIPNSNLVRISHPDMVLNLEVVTLPVSESGVADGSALSLPALLTGAPKAIATGLTVQPDGAIALIHANGSVEAATGAATVTGSVDTSGDRGGAVTVVGDQVALLNATINVSGESDAGSVRLGGDLQGGEALPGSQFTYVDGTTAIAADGGGQGDGGHVILWSDGATLFSGQITATGGNVSGDGGMVEVSGEQYLAFRGTVDTTANQGATGTLLLDPTDIVILNGSVGDGTANDGDDPGASPTELSIPDIAAADLGPSQIYESELEGLNGNTNIALRASNSITINDLLDNELRFQSGTGSITFEAGGTFQMLDRQDEIEASDRNITITAGAIDSGNLETAGAITLTSTATDTVVNTLTAGTGGISINAARRFQAVGSNVDLLSIRLEAATDGDLIEFLSRGDPDLLIDAGLVDGPNPDNFQTRIFIPTSVLTVPQLGEEAPPISIVHGGQAVTTSLDDGKLFIQGTGAFPDIQFVVGPQNDHDITITNPGTNIVNGVFDNFSTLYPAGTFPTEASGATGAIVRRATDSSLVTSFQNQPFVPMIDDGPGTTPIPTNPSTPAIEPGSGQPEIAGATAATTSLENLSAERTAQPNSRSTAAATDIELSNDEEAIEACEAEVSRQSANEVEIISTCPDSAADDAEADD